MNRNMWKWLLVASLSLNVGFAATVIYNHLRATPASRNAHPASLPDHLQLTAEQRILWQQIEQGFITDLATNWGKIRQHREALIKHIFSAQSERAKIDVEQASIAVLQDAQQRRVITQLLAERELLDQQQRVALMALLLDRYTNAATEEEMLHRDH